MVFRFLQSLRKRVSAKQFKLILEACDSDIKFNRIAFGKLTGPEVYIKICSQCENVILKAGV